MTRLETPPDRARNPVAGALLVLGLTVVCSAALGTFLIGVGDDAAEPEPNAVVEIETMVRDGADGFVTLRVAELSPADGVTVTAATTDGTRAIADGSANGTAELVERRGAPGESITVRKVVGDEPRSVELRLVAVAERGDRDAVVLDRTVIV